MLERSELFIYLSDALSQWNLSDQTKVFDKLYSMGHSALVRIKPEFEVVLVFSCYRNPPQSYFDYNEVEPVLNTFIAFEPGELQDCRYVSLSQKQCTKVCLQPRKIINKFDKCFCVQLEKNTISEKLASDDLSRYPGPLGHKYIPQFMIDNQPPEYRTQLHYLVATKEKLHEFAPIYYSEISRFIGKNKQPDDNFYQMEMRKHQQLATEAQIESLMSDFNASFDDLMITKEAFMAFSDSINKPHVYQVAQKHKVNDLDNNVSVWQGYKLHQLNQIANKYFSDDTSKMLLDDEIDEVTAKITHFIKEKGISTNENSIRSIAKLVLPECYHKLESIEQILKNEAMLHDVDSSCPIFLRVLNRVSLGLFRKDPTVLGQKTFPNTCQKNQVENALRHVHGLRATDARVLAPLIKIPGKK